MLPCRNLFPRPGDAFPSIAKYKHHKFPGWILKRMRCEGPASKFCFERIQLIQWIFANELPPVQIVPLCARSVLSTEVPATWSLSHDQISPKLCSDFPELSPCLLTGCKFCRDQNPLVPHRHSYLSI